MTQISGKNVDRFGALGRRPVCWIASDKSGHLLEKRMITLPGKMANGKKLGHLATLMLWAVLSAFTAFPGEPREVAALAGMAALPEDEKNDDCLDHLTGEGSHEKKLGRLGHVPGSWINLDKGVRSLEERMSPFEFSYEPDHSGRAHSVELSLLAFVTGL
ncbi:MAG: hypothetical protein AB1405_15150 [Bdellovibrionota bacterium]